MMQLCLSDAQIVSALKKCISEGNCKRCPLHNKYKDCISELMKIAAERIDDVSTELANYKREDTQTREQELLDHIKELQAEIVRYESYMDCGDKDLGDNFDPYR